VFDGSLNQDYYNRAKILPGRSCTRSKAPGRLYAVDAGPLYSASGYESTLVDVDGRTYIDMLCALGAISLGYKGGQYWGPGVFSLPNRQEVIAAEQVIEHVAPWASSVKFFKTGSEATHAAYRIAKKATGREHVMMGDWAYHGWYEWCDDPSFRYTHRFPHNRTQWIETWDLCAAIFIEPHRWDPLSVEWMQYIRKWCSERGILLVFDSMIYGGRWALGGASAYYGVTPDLEVFGKALGNGHSVAFVVGNEPLAKYGELASGTYSGDVVGLSALCDTLAVYLKEPVIETLWERGRQLQAGLQALCARFPQLGVAEGAPVHQRIHWNDPAVGKQFTAEMAARGVLMHPDCINVCYAHTHEQIEVVLAAAFSSATRVSDAMVRASV
jgi:glutamate-1-semialdehyde aminotransferase